MRNHVLHILASAVSEQRHHRGVAAIEVLAQLQLAGGGLSNGFSNQVTLAGTKVVNDSTNKLTLSIAGSSGLFRGTVVNPATGKVIPLKGILLQKQNLGCGFFSFTNQTGTVYFGQ